MGCNLGEAIHLHYLGEALNHIDRKPVSHFCSKSVPLSNLVKKVYSVSGGGRRLGVGLNHGPSMVLKYRDQKRLDVSDLN